MMLAIMQPTYLPWLGYFDMLDQVDVFVILDTVQFERQSWQQRNRIKTAGGVSWLTVPIVHVAVEQRILETQVDSSKPWERKHLLSLEHAYARAAHWKAYREPLEQLYSADCRLLPDVNVHFICALSDWLGLDWRPKLFKTSELSVSGKRTELLVNICRYFGAKTYLSPQGAAAYLQDDNPFPAADIELRYHVYDHPTYAQLHGPFVSHLTALDLILNTGLAAGEVMRSGRQPAGISPAPHIARHR